MLNIFITNNEDISKINVTNENKNVGTIFIINTHCKFKETEKFQDQGGVKVYRQLLSKYKDCQEKLKVIFYSPISKDDLVKLKPENYVLTFLPFIELFPSTEQYGIKPEEWTFEKALTVAENEISPQFNNASESLLSGWAIANKEKIKTGHEPERINTSGKKIMFIDDQQTEWLQTFTTIFKDKGKRVVYLTSNIGSLFSQQDFKYNFLSVSARLQEINQQEKIELFLSDFYLKESHEILDWKGNSKVKSISGFKLFCELRAIFPATPYVFHTSSNKAAIYKFMDINGIDDWLVKDTRRDCKDEEKLENFEVFRACLKGYLETPVYYWMKDIWEEIRGISYIQTTETWKNNYSDDIIRPILQSSWFAIRRELNREILFEQSLGLMEHNSSSFNSTSVCNNLCKILEVLKFNNSKKYPSSFLFEVRHEASHFSSLNDFTLNDAILYFKLFFKCLKSEIAINGYDNYFHKTEIIKQNGKKTWISHTGALFWLYVMFYNSVTNWNQSSFEYSILKFRIEQLFNKYKTEVVFENLLLNDIKLSKLLDNGIDINKPYYLKHDDVALKYSVNN